jgi:uncharacterized protein YbaA (DUF1428 family)
MTLVIPSAARNLKLADQLQIPRYARDDISEENPMPKYVDGFVLPVPKKNVQAYRRMAQAAGKVWRKLGALEFRECVADDLRPMGVSFRKLIKAKPSETVFFSYIVFRSRAERDRVNKKVMKDPGIAKMMEDPKAMPFDAKRMAYGGFKVLVDL